MGNIDYSSLKNISFTKCMGTMLIFPQSTNYKSSYILPMAKPFVFVGMTKPK